MSEKLDHDSHVQVWKEAEARQLEHVKYLYLSLMASMPCNPNAMAAQRQLADLRRDPGTLLHQLTRGSGIFLGW
jgi:hypothetical protein